jgi:hypothetical protein
MKCSWWWWVTTFRLQLRAAVQECANKRCASIAMA